MGIEHPYEQLAMRFGATLKVPARGPRYNVAPTDPVPVVVQHAGERGLIELRWGLVPSFARDVSVGARFINARAETVETQPAFRDAFAARRCIVPATRFYEWERVAGARLPYSILRGDGFPLSFAGLWASWRDRRTGERVLSCSVITTEPNTVLRPIHDRMPAVLPDDTVDVWLDSEFHDLAALKSMLRPCADDELYAYRVPTLVNNVRNDGPELVEPLGVAGGKRDS